MVIAVRQDDPRSPAVAALLRFHYEDARTVAPASHAFVLDPEGLSGPDVSFLTAWDGDALAGIAALKELGAGHAEVKSMRTDPAHLRKGVGAALLGHLIALAQARGLDRLSLETGTADIMAPARALYRRFGFVDCAAFAGYPAETPYNCYMTLALREA